MNIFTKPLKPLTAYLLIGIVGLGIGLLLSTSVNAAEFQQGSEYRVTRATGLAHVTCNYYQNGRYFTRRAQVRCSSDFSSPEAYSRFTHTGSEATSVRITNNSNSRSKTKTFYASKGESKRFNLLVRTLFQKPLLKLGSNNLNYQLLLKDGSVEEEGRFDVNVDFRRKQCRTSFMYSSNPNDCQGYSVCGRYFYEARCL